MEPPAGLQTTLSITRGDLVDIGIQDLDVDSQSTSRPWRQQAFCLYVVSSMAHRPACTYGHIFASWSTYLIFAIAPAKLHTLLTISVTMAITVRYT